MTSVPVSVMAADVEHESLWVILKIISAKTKALAACEDFLEMRGIYRSGLLGKGVAGMLDLHDPGDFCPKALAYFDQRSGIRSGSESDPVGCGSDRHSCDR